MMKNMIIVGGGPAGFAAALAAKAAGGGSVTLVEREAIGGTCTNRGCIPTKLLLTRSASLDGAAGSAANGGAWVKLIAHKKSLVTGLSRAMAARCRDAGVEIVPGVARLTGSGGVRVETGRGERPRELHAGLIILCPGSAPGRLPGVAIDGRTVITSDEALGLSRLPASLAIVGSGAVGAEFACIFRRFGVDVTVVEAAGRLFPAEEPEVDAAFRLIWERDGIRALTGDPVSTVETREGGADVVLRSGQRIAAEMVLVAAGRRLLSAELGCDAAGVALGARGEILVDSHLATTAEGIYAAGDITGRMLLAHVATRDGEAAARHALGVPAAATPYHATPWATFTSPEVGAVGLTEESARKRGVRAAAYSAPFMDNVKSRIDRSAQGFVKLVADARDGKLIGGTVVGSHGSEMVHSIGVAIHAGMTAADFARFVFLHPSASETIGDAAHGLNSVLQQSDT